MRTKKKKFSLSTFILVILLLVGLSVMLYPTFSDWWNKRVQSHAVAGYDQVVAEMDNSEAEEMLARAQEYNADLLEVYGPFTNPDHILPGYDTVLNISGTGIMGYISIPVINVELPIYHGTSAEVLNNAAGHMEGSSLPIGGPSTHSVISAHRGLPSARLFTDLDRVVVGDWFTITVLKEILTYEVEDIIIVLPQEVDKLAVIPGEDIVTLMTCTPYGINTHRLLVRGRRIANVEEARTVLVPSDATQVDPMLVVPAISAPLVIGLLIFWMWGGSRRKNTLKAYENPLSALPGWKEEG